MSAWQIVDEAAHDRVGLINSRLGFELYIPHWSNAQIETTHSPPESGIRAESVCCHAKSSWTYSLTHIEDAGATATPAYLLEVWIDYCLVTTLRLPFEVGVKLRQKWLEKNR